jgi:glycosyltransferase involved in cell wall biosynthesis
VKQRLLIITNLYPLPWEPQRGTFNCQQFSRLTEHFDVRVVVPVPFTDWFARKKEQLFESDDYSGPQRWLFPYFFTPKIFRNLYPLMMKWSLRWQLFNRIKKYQPDYVIGSWLYPDGIVAADIANQLQVPYVLKAHGSDINVYLDNTMRGEKILQACRQARKIIVVSRALKDILLSRGIDSSQIDVLYNGVDAQLFYPELNQQSSQQSEVGKRLLFIGNLKHDKGVMELLEAFATLADRSHRLTIVGDGVMRGAMQRFVQVQDLTERIHFAGSLPHTSLPALMRAADLLVLPSYREGVPNVILEAMASGLPVVATDVGGIPEIVEPGVSGFLVPARNVEALKEAIESALAHCWNSTVVAAKAKQFDWSSNIECLRQAIVQPSDKYSVTKQADRGDDVA